MAQVDASDVETIVLRVKAPFAAFRWMQAGAYRATSPVIPPSAAWGLVLNIAGINTRGALDEVTTQIRKDAPGLDIAVGSRTPASVSTVYQQLHSYPVGNSGKELKEKSYGSKFWIAPVRREFLVDFDCLVAVRGERSVVGRIRPGLAGTLDGARFGLPFAGDNNFLLESVEILDLLGTAHWYEVLEEDGPPLAQSCRLTVNLDRAHAQKSQSALFAPLSLPSAVTDRALVHVGPASPDIRPVFGARE